MPVLAIGHGNYGTLFFPSATMRKHIVIAPLEKATAMAYNSKAKLKVLYLWKILQEETDAEHGLSMTQILERLDSYGISAERKSIYDDIKTLRDFDIDIKTYQRNPVEYAIERRDFTLEELMLMVDAVQSCRAITERQARMLITNIKQLATNREQALLDRRIHVEGRIKSKSESVLSTVDAIHEALRLRCKVAFSYRKIGADGKPHETREGKRHEVTPVAISYDDGFYYLTAWNDHHANLTEYRLDRMAKVNVERDMPATRNEEIASYAFDQGKAVMFGRFNGEEVACELTVDPDKVEIITDRFGKSASFLPFDGQQVRARVKVCKSQQFFGWVASMGRAVSIAAPQSLVEEYRDYLHFLLEE